MHSRVFGDCWSGGSTDLPEHKLEYPGSLRPGESALSVDLGSMTIISRPIDQHCFPSHISSKVGTISRILFNRYPTQSGVTKSSFVKGRVFRKAGKDLYTCIEWNAISELLHMCALFVHRRTSKSVIAAHCASFDGDARPASAINAGV